MHQRALAWLGVQYDVEPDGKVHISDIGKLIEGLREYQTEGLKILERKIAPVT